MYHSEWLDKGRIQAHLTDEALRALPDIQIFDELDSTNRWALQHGHCGSVCLAEQQTAGRGRRGRQWYSPAGVNIYLSVRWCFDQVLAHLPMLGLVTGVAVAEALQIYGISGHGLKWPNDIYWQGKKLGGILLEASGNLQQVVIGIGLNVNVQPEINPLIEQPWSSLQIAHGKVIARNTLIGVILNQLVYRLQDFPYLNGSLFQQEWQPWDVLAQRSVRVLAGEEIFEGIACGVDSQGQLRLSLMDGLIKTFSSADVSVRM